MYQTLSTLIIYARDEQWNKFDLLFTDDFIKNNLQLIVGAGISNENVKDIKFLLYKIINSKKYSYIKRIIGQINAHNKAKGLSYKQLKFGENVLYSIYLCIFINKDYQSLNNFKEAGYVLPDDDQSLINFLLFCFNDGFTLLGSDDICNDMANIDKGIDSAGYKLCKEAILTKALKQLLREDAAGAISSLFDYLARDYDEVLKNIFKELLKDSEATDELGDYFLLNLQHVKPHLVAILIEVGYKIEWIADNIIYSPVNFKIGDLVKILIKQNKYYDLGVLFETVFINNDTDEDEIEKCVKVIVEHDAFFLVTSMIIELIKNQKLDLLKTIAGNASFKAYWPSPILEAFFQFEAKIASDIIKSCEKENFNIFPSKVESSTSSMPVDQIVQSIIAIGNKIKVADIQTDTEIQTSSCRPLWLSQSRFTTTKKHGTDQKNEDNENEENYTSLKSSNSKRLKQ